MVYDCMWQFNIEIEDHSFANFNCFFPFKVLYQLTSVKGRAYCSRISVVCPPLLTAVQWYSISKVVHCECSNVIEIRDGISTWDSHIQLFNIVPMQSGVICPAGVWLPSVWKPWRKISCRSASCHIVISLLPRLPRYKFFLDLNWAPIR